MLVLMPEAPAAATRCRTLCTGGRGTPARSWTRRSASSAASNGWRMRWAAPLWCGADAAVASTCTPLPVRCDCIDSLAAHDPCLGPSACMIPSHPNTALAGGEQRRRRAGRGGHRRQLHAHRDRRPEAGSSAAAAGRRRCGRSRQHLQVGPAAQRACMPGTEMRGHDLCGACHVIGHVMAAVHRRDLADLYHN